MGNTTVKIPRSTYLAAKAAAKKRGCFIGKIIADALTLYLSTPPQGPVGGFAAQSKTEAA